MPVGLQVLGTDGYVQLTSDIKTFQFLSKHTVNISTSVPSGYPVFRGILNITGNSPLVAMYSTGQPVSMAWATRSGNTTSFNFFAPASTSIEAYVFNSTEVVSRANFGLEVFNGSGSLVYTSTQPAFRILIANTQPTWSSLNSGVSKPGVIINTPRGFGIPFDTQFNRMTEGYRVSGSTIFKGDVPMPEVLPSPGPNIQGFITIVDLTGF